MRVSLLLLLWCVVSQDVVWVDGCAAGMYSGTGTIRRYPPTPTAGYYSWAGGLSTTNTLTVSGSNTAAGYGLGAYTVVGSVSIWMGAANQVGSPFNYRLDENYNTVWYSTYVNAYAQSTGVYYSSQSLAGRSGEWIYIRLPVAIVMKQYVINAWTGGMENRSPQRWYVLGSLDGATWTQLDVQDYATGVNYGYYSTGSYISGTIAGTTAYTYFALVVNAISRNLPNPNTGVNFQEWQVYGYEPSCTACGVGAYSAGTGFSTCALCSTGAYSTGTGLSVCVNCVAGAYSTGTGLTLASVCANCAAGAYSTGTGGSACVNCAAGAYSTGTGGSTCVNCVAGAYYTGTGGSVCVNCAVGAYSTGTGLTAASVCTKCAAGAYSTGTGGSACVNCVAGAYYTGTGGSTCALCAAGAYFTGTGLTQASGCALCAVGTFSPTVGLGTATCQSCGACGAGGFKSSDCASGATANTMVCQCSAGFYGDGTTCAGCKTCHANAASVSSCPVNSATDTSVCACNAGYYGNGLVCAGCKTCHANATSVSSCTVNSVVDTSACACNAGHYGNGLACAVCPVNAYCGAGVSEPQTCPTHTLSSAGSSSQLDCLCEAGFFCRHTKALNAVMTLNCTAEDFANDVNGVRTRLILAIAAASNVPPSQVHIQGYVPHVRSFHRGTSVRGLKVSVTVLGATHINFVQYGSTRVLAMRWHEAHRVQVEARAI